MSGAISKMGVDRQFWRGKRVGVTGHTGFKGSWLSLLLKELGAEVFGYALAPNTSPNLYESASIGDFVDSEIADIRDLLSVQNWVNRVKPDIVIHLAAQALVRESYLRPVDTMTSNIVGTLNILEAIRQQPEVRAAVIVTTDKVYRNEETAGRFKESDSLGGHDPYSASKAASEIVVSSYCSSFLEGRGIATARAGNVIGGGDWSADRLIPDAIRAWNANTELDVRRPDAVRPWQHVIEPLRSYLVLAQALFEGKCIEKAFNFGPETDDAVSVKDVVSLAQSIYGKGATQFAESMRGPHEAGFLCLDIELARTSLGIVPKWHLKQAVETSINWYKEFYQGADARELCISDIKRYFDL